MNQGDKVKFFESAKHKLEEAIITKVHGNGLFNVEVLRGKVRVAFNSLGTAMQAGGAYIVAHTQPKTPAASPPIIPPKPIDQPPMGAPQLPPVETKPETKEAPNA